MLFYFILLLWTIIYSIFTIPILIFLPMHVRIKSSVFAVKVVLLILKYCKGIDYEVKGLEHLPQTPYIIASAHQSPLETLILTTIFKNPVYIMKKELMFLPFLGIHFMLLKMIFIDRKNKIQSLKKIISSSELLIKKGRTVIIFPQGTRVPIGQKIGYQPGITLLYKKLLLPVVPVALNTGLFWPKSIFAKHKAGKATIEILSPIPPGLSKDQFLKEIESKIESRVSFLVKQ